MSFDHRRFPSYKEASNTNKNTNTNTNLSIMDQNNEDTDPKPPSTNSLKHIKSKSTSPEYHYKYSKNKHLSQQIHKRKKNRTKQTQHKKKKQSKFQNHGAKSSSNNHHHHHHKKHKRPKLNKGIKSTDNHHYGLGYDRDDFKVTYIKQYNKMTDKHKKIQVVNNSNNPYYYLQQTSSSNNNLTNYNYNNNNFQQEKQIKLNLRDNNGTKYVQNTKLTNMPSPLPFNANSKNNNNGNLNGNANGNENLSGNADDDPNNTPKIWWIPTLHKAPSPMILPSASNSNLKLSSPFLVPVCKIPGARKVCNISSMSPSNKSVNSDRCLMESTHQETKVGDNNKGECILGFEATNANVLFRSLSDIRPLTSQSSRPMSIISDYKYEGLCHHSNPERVDYDISNCLNILRSVNNSRENYYARQLSLDKLNEIEMIIQQLKNKIIDDGQEIEDEDHEDEEKKEEEEDERKRNEEDNEYQTDVTSTTQMTTDSSLHHWRARRSLHTNSPNSSEDEHENEDEDEDEDEDDEDTGLIGGVRLMENPTPDGGDVDNIEYYD